MQRNCAITQLKFQRQFHFNGTSQRIRIHLFGQLPCDVVSQSHENEWLSMWKGVEVVATISVQSATLL